MTRATTSPILMLALTMTPAWSGCSVRTQSAALNLVNDPEAYAVYASLLPNEWPVRVENARRLVFQQETSTTPECMPSGEPLETDWREVVDNFRAENSSTRAVRPGFPLGRPYIVVPKSDIDARFRGVRTDPWSGFYKRYPDSGGYIVVSAVGFDPSKERAMVYLSHSCGLLCGGGAHHLLEKVDGAWRKATLPGVRTCSWES